MFKAKEKQEIKIEDSVYDIPEYVEPEIKNESKKQNGSHKNEAIDTEKSEVLDAELIDDKKADFEEKKKTRRTRKSATKDEKEGAKAILNMANGVQAMVMRYMHIKALKEDPGMAYLMDSTVIEEMSDPLGKLIGTFKKNMTPGEQLLWIYGGHLGMSFTMFQMQKMNNQYEKS